MRRKLLAAAAVVAALGCALLGVAFHRARLVDPGATLMLLDRHGAFLGEVGEGYDERLGFWPITSTPPRVAAATLVIEDRRFYDHVGVDPKAIARAVHQNVTNGERISGASTIPMQVARLQNPGGRTYSRKVLEALTAVFLVARHGREKVLQQYLTLAPYGNNVHGVAYASRRYFHKPVADLSWAETALLAGMPQAPGRMNPYTTSGRRRGIERAEQILDLLRAEGSMSSVEHGRAVDELQTLYFPERPTRPAATLHAILHLEKTLPTHLRATPIVHTTLDLQVQTRIQGQLAERIREWEDRGAGNAAVVVVDRATWQVVASVGSTGWYDRSYAGAIDYTRALRYPGSTLKPFVYGYALDQGVIAPNSILEDLGRGPGGVRNADNRFLGPLLPRQALANSRNVPAVLLMEQVGLNNAYGLYRELGLHQDTVSVDHYGIGIAIGGMPTTLVDLVTAYTAIAGDGRVQTLGWYEGAPQPVGRRVLTQSTTEVLAMYLSDPIARLPSFPRRGASEYPFPAAVKTGTSPDYRDAWAVAWSERYLVGVWVGHPDWTPMNKLGGYSAAAPVARDVLVDLHDSGVVSLADSSFPPPANWVGTEICPLSGAKATARCHQRVVEYFPANGEPVHNCQVHIEVGGKSVAQLPTKFHGWARKQGLPLAPARMPGLGETVTVELISPRDGQVILRDPEAPAGRGSMVLRATVDPPVDAVVWYVDGNPIATVAAPYTTRWQIEPGEHIFEVRAALIDAGSRRVRISGG